MNDYRATCAWSAMKDTKASFLPVAAPSARILILGSMPGEASLSARQYYAHPRNAFWPIMAELLRFDPQLSYERRLRELCRHGIALWDVIGRCRRRGSADANIESDSIELNDFAALFARCPEIRHVLFNGRKAEQEFVRRLSASDGTGYPQLNLRLMPSTSPAYAVMDFGQKLQRWRVLTRLIGAGGPLPAEFADPVAAAKVQG